MQNINIMFRITIISVLLIGNVSRSMGQEQQCNRTGLFYDDNCINACNKTFTQGNGLFQSKNYQDSQACKFILKNPNGDRIHFGLEYNVPCASSDTDSLVVYDGTEENGLLFVKNCDTYQTEDYSQEDNSYYSSGDTLTVMFESNAIATPNSSVKVQWSYSRDFTKCNDTIYTSNSGVLTSPDYPGQYSPFLDCKQTIRVSPGSKVILNFVRLDVEEWLNCMFDKLLIYDGDDLNAVQPKRYCGTSGNVPRFESQRETVTVHLVTDNSIQGQGYEISWEAVPVNECDNNPCVNGGVCNDGIWQYTCTCPPAWTGPNCEIDHKPDCKNWNPCAGSNNHQYMEHADPTKFITCSNGHCHPMPCPAGLTWNNQISVCDHATGRNP